MHNNRNMVIHIRTNISQENRCNNRHRAKSRTGVINILVARCIGFLSGKHDHLVRGLVVADARDGFQEREERCASIDDGVVDEGCVMDAEFREHGIPDHLGGVGDEFFDKDVIVDAVACSYVSGSFGGRKKRRIGSRRAYRWSRQ